MAPENPETLLTTRTSAAPALSPASLLPLVTGAQVRRRGGSEEVGDIMRLPGVLGWPSSAL